MNNRYVTMMAATATTLLSFACSGEDYAGSVGATGSSTTLEGSTTAGDPPVVPPACGDQASPAEICGNAKDDDCDGTIDEEPCACESGSQRACGEDQGLCASGTQTCDDGEWGACEGLIGPTPDLCDGVDNDCDGYVDPNCECLDGHISECGTSDVGACVKGSRQCEAGTWGPCENAIEPALELCDGLDNDCDGAVDNTVDACQCVNDAIQPCGSDEGECVVGTQVCIDGTWAACTGVAPVEESCNALDDDCDGAVDDGVLNACGQCGPEPEEVCNFADDDCDGLQDDANGVQNGLHNACDGCGPTPTEVCDDVDNDCDGLVDEDIADCNFSINSSTFLAQGNKTFDVVVPKPPQSNRAPITLIDEFNEVSGEGYYQYYVTYKDEGASYRFTIKTVGGTAQSFVKGRVAVLGMGKNGEMSAISWTAPNKGCDNKLLLGQLPTREHMFIGSDGYEYGGDRDVSWEALPTQVGNSTLLYGCASHGNGNSKVTGRALSLKLPPKYTASAIAPVQIKAGSEHVVTWKNKSGVFPLVGVITYATDTKNHFSFSTKCGQSGADYTCTVKAYNSGNFLKAYGALIDM